MNIILGTMTFGEQLWEDDAIYVMKEFMDLGYNHIDTAYVYNDGNSERIIGEALKGIKRDLLYIDSKVNPRITGRLDAEAVQIQLEESLRRLGVDYIDTYYLHFPDANTPMESALEKINEYWERGYIRELGLSNFPVGLVERVNLICENNRWIKPSVYEGLYNPLSRKAEFDLFKCLDKLKIRFACYNPLAGGILTDRYKDFNTLPSNGRFINRPNYQARYWKPSYFEAVNLLKEKCRLYQLNITEVAFRWLANSSMLNAKKGDAIIIGVSKLRHLKENIKYVNEEKLPDEILNAFDDAWNLCKEEAPEYYRFYGAK